jgi:hypothetical protein
MANVDGTWNVEIKTPMGAQKGTLIVNSNGDSFTGQMSGDVGTVAIDDGTVAGDTLSWKMKITKPMPMEVTNTATVAGDQMTGKVDTGAFGAFDLVGTRA